MAPAGACLSAATPPPPPPPSSCHAMPHLPPCTPQWRGAPRGAGGPAIRAVGVPGWMVQEGADDVHGSREDERGGGPSERAPARQGCNLACCAVHTPAALLLLHIREARPRQLACLLARAAWRDHTAAQCIAHPHPRALSAPPPTKRTRPPPHHHHGTSAAQHPSSPAPPPKKPTSRPARPSSTRPLSMEL